MLMGGIMDRGEVHGVESLEVVVGIFSASNGVTERRR